MYCVCIIDIGWLKPYLVYHQNLPNAIHGDLTSHKYSHEGEERNNNTSIIRICDCLYFTFMDFLESRYQGINKFLYIL